MPLKVKHELFGELTKNPPTNAEGLRINLNLEADKVEQSASVSNFEWRLEEAAKLKQYFKEGLTGGLGIFENPDHSITFEDGENTLRLDLMVNMKSATFDRDFVGAESVALADVDNIYDKAAGVTFERLAAEGTLTKASYIYIPYVQTRVPDYGGGFLTVLTFAVVEIQFEALINKLKEGTTEAVTVIDSIGGVIGLVFTVLYLIIVVAKLVDLIFDFFTFIIQRVKYLPAMRLNDLLRIGAAAIGMTYECALLESAPLNRLVVIPPRQSIPPTGVKALVRGLFSPNEGDETGYYKGAFDALLLEVTRLFRLRLAPDGQVLRIVPRSFVPTGATVTLPDVDQKAFRTNASELVSNLNLSFPVDAQDLTTVDRYEGNDVNVHYAPIVVGDLRKVTLAGGLAESFGFSRAFRKKKLNLNETLFRDLLQVVDILLAILSPLTIAVNATVRAATKLINALFKALKVLGIKKPPQIQTPPKYRAPDLSGLIDNRVGALELEKDTFGNHKICLVDIAQNARNTKISTDNETIINSKFIAENYWADVNEQKLLIDFENIELSLSDVIAIKSEQAVNLADGRVARVLSLEYNGDETGGLADLSVSVSEKYTNNIKTIVTTNKGR